MYSLKDFIDYNRIPVFVCIGTMRSKYDGVSPRIGSILKELGYFVIGTIEEQCHARTIKNIIDTQLFYLDPNIYQVIGIDACLGIEEDVYFKVFKGSIAPRSGMGEPLGEIGEVSIHCNIQKDSDRDTTMLNLLTNRGDEDLINKIIDSVTHDILEALTPADKELQRKVKTMKMAHMIIDLNLTTRDIEKLPRGYKRQTVSNHVNRYMKEINPYAYEFCKNVFRYKKEVCCTTANMQFMSNHGFI